MCFARNVVLLVTPGNIRSQRTAEKIGGAAIGARIDGPAGRAIAYRITSRRV